MTTSPSERRPTSSGSNRLAPRRPSRLADALESDAERIDIAGRQRMLVQRLVLGALVARSAGPSSEPSSVQIGKKLIATCDAMLTGGRVIQLQTGRVIELKASASPAAAAAVQASRDAYEQLRKAAAAYLAEQGTARSQALLLATERRAARAADEAVAAIKQASRERTGTLAAVGAVLRTVVLFIAIVLLWLSLKHRAALRVWRAASDAIAARLDGVLKSVVDGIIVIDERGRIQSINPAAERIFGWSEAETIGQNVSIFMPTPYREEHDGYLANYRDTGVKRVINIGRTVEGLRRDGTRFPLELGVSEVISDGDRLFAGITRDISARVALEDALVAKNEELAFRNSTIARQNIELARANRMKSRFLANMSHELRTPLNAVIGFSDVLDDGAIGSLNEQQHDYVREINDAGRHLLSLITDILDLSKIEAGKMTLDIERVDLPALLRQAMSIVREKAARSGVSLVTAIDDDVGEVDVDPRKVRQIVYNLLANAVKFSTGGAVTLSCSDLPGDRVRIGVDDTGIGIASSDLPGLFAPFHQVDSDMDRRYEGTGLGLALVKNLAELHGGTVGVTSELGKGSQFWVSLPRQPRSHVAADPAAADEATTDQDAASGGTSP